MSFKDDETMMAIRSDREPGHPVSSRGHQMSEAPIGTRFAETIRASGVFCRDNRPDTRLYLTLDNQNVDFFLANQEPSTHDYFIKSGRSDFGVAWKETKDGDEPLEYVKVLLDGPMLNKPVNAALFDHDDGADLVWSRPKKA